jgi:predicted nucleotidyltransferase
MLDKEAVKGIVVDYSNEVRKMLEPTRIILFGSHVNGKPNELSDIDVAVLVKDFEGDWSNMLTKLYGLKWADKFTDIEPHLLDENHDPSGFVEHVIKTGEVVYRSAYP